MRNLATAACAALVIFLSGSVTTSAEVVFPKAGSVGMEAPPSMSQTAAYSGFEDRAEGASILITEMPLEAYSALASGLTPERLLMQGIRVEGPPVAFQTTSGVSGLLYRGSQETGGASYRKWMLLLNGQHTTPMITAQARGAPYNDETILTAFKSIRLTAPRSLEDQIGALPFAVRDIQGFKPIHVLAGSALVLADSPTPDSLPQVVVASSLGAAKLADPPAEAALKSLRTAPFTDLVVEGQDKRKDWHIIRATAVNRSGRPVIVRQAMAFAPTGYIRALGVFEKNASAADLARWDALVDSIALQ